MSLLGKLKKIKLYQYLLVAIFVHVVLSIYFRCIIVVSPMTHKVLFKSKMVVRPKEPVVQPRRRAIKELPTVTKIPAKIIPQPPKTKKTIVVKKAPKAPTIEGKLPEIKPEKLELAKTKKIDTKRVVVDRKMQRQEAVKQFARKFDISGKGKTVEATFTPVLASYAGGDWNINPNAIPNLMLELTRRTNVKAQFSPILVKMDSSEIFKSPFVYFTGTKDFRLTEKEVEHLRKYLLQGGRVYADNSLPGKRSRFDIAFRREMARVLPQYHLEPISPDHPIFSSVYKIKGTPVGMNWRRDPIEIIKIHGRTAVIYTLNDYGDLWETKFRKDGTVETDLNEKWQRDWGPHWGRWEYENVNQESIEYAYQMGINIIAYLLEELSGRSGLR